MIEKNKIKSIITNLISFGIQLAISLLITPIILKKVGTDAYGFIGLSNDFITYLTVITSVINSVAGRFIAVAMYKNQVEKADMYFNSVLVVNITLSLVFIAVGCIFIPNIEFFLDVPIGLVTDVKLTFLFTLLAYLISIVVSVYTTSTFVKDRLDLQGVRNILQYGMRGILVLLLFTIFPAKLYWLSVISCIVTLITTIYDIFVYKKIMPEIKIDIRKFNFDAIKTLAASGGLLAITNLSSILLSGLDLLIANKILGAYDMGLLSAAKTLPNSLTSAVIVVASLFTPQFIKLYSEGKTNQLIDEVDKAMRTIVFVLFVPLVGFVIFSHDFYELWLNGKSVGEIWVVTLLSNITVLEIFFNAITFPLSQLSLVTNKMKLPVLISFFIGVANTIIVLLTLEFANGGVYIIATVSTILLIVRYLFFNPWYAAKILDVNKGVFYKISYKKYLFIPFIGIIIYLVKKIIFVNSWISLFTSAMLCGVISYIALYVVILFTYKNKTVIDRH